jgi:hypothetical protein
MVTSGPVWDGYGVFATVGVRHLYREKFPFFLEKFQAGEKKGTNTRCPWDAVSL